MAALPEHLLLVASQYTGQPYGLPPGPGQVDCSLYALKVYSDCGMLWGGDVRTAEQIRQASVVVPLGQVQAGDLLFVDQPEDRMEPVAADGHCATHVAISLGQDSKRVWSAQDPAVKEVLTVNNPWWQGLGQWANGGIFEARRHPQMPLSPLRCGYDVQFSIAELFPVINQYANLYGVDLGLVMAGIAMQESSFVNRKVHDDGHGRGLLGLDDRYGLRDFEVWTKTRWCTDGQPVASVPPVLQFEYLAYWLSAKSTELGSVWNAARVWHTGQGGDWQSQNGEGALYERLVRGHIDRLGLA